MRAVAVGAVIGFYLLMFTFFELVRFETVIFVAAILFGYTVARAGIHLSRR